MYSKKKTEIKIIYHILN